MIDSHFYIRLRDGSTVEFMGRYMYDLKDNQFAEYALSHKVAWFKLRIDEVISITERRAKRVETKAFALAHPTGFKR
jgi:hypothetical protein